MAAESHLGGPRPTKEDPEDERAVLARETMTKDERVLVSLGDPIIWSRGLDLVWLFG